MLPSQHSLFLKLMKSATEVFAWHKEIIIYSKASLNGSFPSYVREIESLSKLFAVF